MLDRRLARGVTWLAPALAVLLRTTDATAADLYVAPGGDDGGPGTQAAPWATLQHAADTALPGDTVHVADGTYQGFDVRTVASEAAPLRFVADGGGAIVDQDNPVTPDGINVENAAWVTIEGFVVEGSERTGIRCVESPHVTIRGNVARDNFKWGILTGCCEDILIEGNETSGSVDEHGIYHSNSADRPVIRGNLVWGNNANGIHVNSDFETGCESIAFDGVISDALIEQNVIFDNGRGGGSGINCDGVQDALVQNNLVYEAHASGISFYRIDGAEGPARNTVTNNTVLVAEDGRRALNFIDGAIDGRVRNNILFAFGAGQGAIRVSADSLPGLDSDFNVVSDTMTADGDETLLDLAEWQALGFDGSSLLADPAAVFVDLAASDHHLAETSPARDAGDPATCPAQDLEGSGRPVGAAPDIGAYEYGGVPGPGATTTVGAGGGEGTSASAGGDGAAGPGAGPGSGGDDPSGAGPAGPGSGDAGPGAVVGSGGGDAAEDGGDDGCGCRVIGARAVDDRAIGLAVAAAVGIGALARRRRRG